MHNEQTRAKRDEQPPSTPGTSHRRARFWPLVAGTMAIALVALVAQVASADPIGQSVQTTARAAQAVSATQAPVAQPAQAVSAEPTGSAFAALGDVALVSAAAAANAAGAVDITPPPPPPTTTTTTAPPTTTTAAPAPAPVAAAPSTGRCGGDLPPCYIMNRESGGSLTAKNPSSTASGKWQFLDSTWAGYGGYGSASMAPESVQDAKARALWAGGSGCGHWSAC